MDQTLKIVLLLVVIMGSAGIASARYSSLPDLTIVCSAPNLVFETTADDGGALAEKAHVQAMKRSTSRLGTPTPVSANWSEKARLAFSTSLAALPEETF